MRAAARVLHAQQPVGALIESNAHALPIMMLVALSLGPFLVCPSSSMAPLYPFIPRDRTYKLSYTSAHDISDSVDSLADTSAAAPFACSLARCHIQSHPHRYPISLSRGYLVTNQYVPHEGHGIGRVHGVVATGDLAAAGRHRSRALQGRFARMLAWPITCETDVGTSLCCVRACVSRVAVRGGSPSAMVTWATFRHRTSRCCPRASSNRS